MKLSKLLLVPVIGIEMILITPFAFGKYMEEGGGVIGSGGDELVTTIPYQTDTLTSPSAFFNKNPNNGTIQVVGESFAGAFAGGKYGIRECNYENSKIVPQSCRPWAYFKLGTRVTVAPGHYQLLYSNSLYSEIVTIHGNDFITELKEIELPEYPDHLVRIERNDQDPKERKKFNDEVIGSSRDQYQFPILLNSSSFLSSLIREYGHIPTKKERQSEDVERTYTYRLDDYYSGEFYSSTQNVYEKRSLEMPKLRYKDCENKNKKVTRLKTWINGLDGFWLVGAPLIKTTAEKVPSKRGCISAVRAAKGNSTTRKNPLYQFSSQLVGFHAPVVDGRISLDYGDTRISVFPGSYRINFYQGGINEITDSFVVDVE